MNRFLLLLLSIPLFISCAGNDDDKIVWPVDSSKVMSFSAMKRLLPVEEAFLEAGLTDVHTLDTTIRVDLKYGSTGNFMGIDFYQGLNKCYLQPEVALMLVKAQKFLKQHDPELTLLVWDAARPLSVQRMMWKKAVPPPGVSKSFFVSNPANGSVHNYGCAVDVTIMNVNGNLLDMGTAMDHFGREAWPVEEQRLLKDGKLSVEQVTNRKLLRSVMYAAGFWNIQTEWWHFNAMRRETAKQRYPIIR